MNRFLSSHRTVAVDKQFVDAGENSYWTFCVEYVVGGPAAPVAAGGHRAGRVDYKEVLPPDQYAKYLELRKLRERVAAEEAVPVFKVFTNEQLAEMVRRGVQTPAEVDAIPGVGAARLERYATRFLAALAGGADEAGGAPVRRHPGP